MISQILLRTRLIFKLKKKLLRERFNVPKRWRVELGPHWLRPPLPKWGHQGGADLPVGRGEPAAERARTLPPRGGRGKSRAASPPPRGSSGEQSPSLKNTASVHRLQGVVNLVGVQQRAVPFPSSLLLKTPQLFKQRNTDENFPFAQS